MASKLSGRGETGGEFSCVCACVTVTGSYGDQGRWRETDWETKTGGVETASEWKRDLASAADTLILHTLNDNTGSSLNNLSYDMFIFRTLLVIGRFSCWEY